MNLHLLRVAQDMTTDQGMVSTGQFLCEVADLLIVDLRDLRLIRPILNTGRVLLQLKATVLPSTGRVLTPIAHVELHRPGSHLFHVIKADAIQGSFTHGIARKKKERTHIMAKFIVLPNPAVDRTVRESSGYRRDRDIRASAPGV